MRDNIHYRFNSWLARVIFPPPTKYLAPHQLAKSESTKWHFVKRRLAKSLSAQDLSKIIIKH